MVMSNEQNSEGKYPKWVTCLFDSHTKCRECGKLLTIDHIVGIGVFCASFFGGDDAGPRSTVTVRCEYCGQDLHITTNADVIQLTQGVESLYDVIAAERMDSTAPWEKLARSKNDRITNQLAPKTPDESKAKRIKRIKRLMARPTDREIKSFLNRLERTSFHRNSKGFRNFMRDLGIDIGGEQEGGE